VVALSLLTGGAVVRVNTAPLRCRARLGAELGRRVGQRGLIVNAGLKRISIYTGMLTLCPLGSRRVVSLTNCEI